MISVLLLDTNVWSHLVLSDLAKRQSVQAALAQLQAKYPEATLATSGVCVAECLVAARRLLDEDQRQLAEDAFRSFFDDPHVIVVEVTQTVLDKAAALRAETLRRAATAAAGGAPAGADGGKLKLPDAVVAASCLDFDPPAVLVTENVGDFRYTDSTGQAQTVAGLVVASVG